MKKITITINGTSPLLMHSARLSNPLDPIAKAMKRVSSKRVKTDDDYLEMARLEHMGGLYFDDEIGPYVPADNIWRCLQDAAKKRKLGQQIKSGLIVTTDVNPLAYDGPRTIDGLWEDENFRHQASVKVQTSRVIRTRPIFQQWATEAEVIYDPTQLDHTQIEEVAELAGTLIGLGDWRPKFGRFESSIEKGN